MNANLGWALAVVGIAAGYMAYGWPGVAMAVSVTVFWLLLQFSRAMRVMRIAGQAPVGRVPSAVMLHAKLKKGHRLMDVILITKSLGQRLSDDPETFCWSDDSDARVTVVLRQGRVTEWALQRPAEAQAAGGPSAPSP
jgi:hypothetical protein